MVSTKTPTHTVKLNIVLSEAQAQQLVEECFELYPKVRAQWVIQAPTQAPKQTLKSYPHTDDKTSGTTIKGTVKSTKNGSTKYFLNSRQAVGEFIARAKLDGIEIDEEMRPTGYYKNRSVDITSLGLSFRNPYALVPSKDEAWATSIMEKGQ